MRRYWFKPKTHGYGAQPTSWEGWALVAGFFVAEIVLAVLTIITAFASLGAWLLFFAGTAALVALLIWVAWLKTDGVWRWRWGGGK
ncbi:MAG: hypothetical protein RLO50_23095 [Azospirillaceae bacterium]